MQLRDYQQTAVNAVYEHLRNQDDNPCVVIPTAGGKTPIIATICRDTVQLWQGRVLILAHVKELLQQAVDKLQQVCPDVRFGVYSAGLKSRDTEGDVIVAGIQSVHQRASELGHFDLVLIDECHLLPKDGDGMYRRFLAYAKQVNPNLRVIGFTATAFRLDSGPLCNSDGPLHAICYEVSVMELIRDGYLCRPVAKAGKDKADASKLSVRGGEFVASEAESLMNTEALVASACREIVDHTESRQACLIFAAGVNHARSIVEAMRLGLGQDCEMVTGDTVPAERKRILDDFRSGHLKYLVNVNVLTTGFDAPNIDCVALLRPTMSPGLYYQMIGRGFRLHPGKQNCLILDFAGNVVRHGPVDRIRLSAPRSGGGPNAKECPQCLAIISPHYEWCPHCRFVFPKTSREPHHDSRASEASVLSDDISVDEYEVHDVSYREHRKRNADPDAPPTMCVEYRMGFNHYQREFICFEHSGFARIKAEQWWRARSRDPVPDTVEQAVELAESGSLAFTESLTVKSVAGQRFDEIVKYRIGPKPQPITAPPDQFRNEELPF